MSEVKAMPAMFPVTVTVYNLTQLDKVRAALYDDIKGAPASPSTAAQPAKEPAAKQTEAAQPDAKVYTVDEAKALTKGAVSNNKKAEVVALLDKYVTALPEGYKGIKTAAHLVGDAVQQFCVEAQKLQKGVA